MTAKECAKCTGGMSEGFVVDHTYGAYVVPQWIEGPPHANVWTGVKVRGRQRSAVATWRCGQCGFLESYAPAEPDGSQEAQAKSQGRKVISVLLLIAFVALAVAITGLMLGR